MMEDFWEAMSELEDAVDEAVEAVIRKYGISAIDAAAKLRKLAEGWEDSQ